MNQLSDFKNIYDKTEVPETLEFVIRQSMRSSKMKKRIIKTIIAMAATVVLFTGMVNVSPSFADAVSNIPVMGPIVKVVSFNVAIDQHKTVEAHIESPIIEGLDNKDLENLLNEKYLSDAIKLYDEFMDEMGEIIKTGGHIGFDSGYEVKTDTNKLLSIARYNVQTMASSYNVLQYDTIDKINGLLITLPSLFKDESYLEVLSIYLLNTMIELNKDEDLTYWVGEDESDAFKNIEVDQDFYITQDNKLVISFDDYDIAPGYMGIQTFEIPTELIQDILVNNNYIK